MEVIYPNYTTQLLLALMKDSRADASAIQVGNDIYVAGGNSTYGYLMLFFLHLCLY